MIRRTIGLLSSQGPGRTGDRGVSAQWFSEYTVPLCASGDGIPSLDGLCRETKIALDADSCFIVKDDSPSSVAHRSWSGESGSSEAWSSEWITAGLRSHLGGSSGYLLAPDAKADPLTRQLANRRRVQGLAVASLHFGSSLGGFLVVEFRDVSPHLNDGHGQFLLGAARICSSAIRCLVERDRRHEAEQARRALLDDMAHAEERGRIRLARQIEHGPLASLRHVCDELTTMSGGVEQLPDAERLHDVVNELAGLEALLSAPEPSVSLSDSIHEVVANFGPSASRQITIRDFTSHVMAPGNHALLIRLVEAAVGEIMSSRSAEQVLIVLRSAGGGTLLSIRASSRGLDAEGGLADEGGLAAMTGATNSAEMGAVCDQILMAGGTCDAKLQSLGMSSVKAWFPD